MVCFPFQQLSSLLFKESSDSADTTDSGKLFQGLTTLWVKNMPQYSIDVEPEAFCYTFW